jgi:hypothetical protein
MNAKNAIALLLPLLILSTGCDTTSPPSLNPPGTTKSTDTKIEPPIVGFDPVLIPLKVEVNTGTLEVSAKIEKKWEIKTPIGKFSLTSGSAKVSTGEVVKKQESEHPDERLLIIKLDDEVYTYKLEKKKIDISFDGNFKKVRVEYDPQDTKSTIFLDLASIPKAIAPGDKDCKSSSQLTVQNYFNMIHNRNYQSAWAMLPQKMKEDKEIHPDGYQSFVKWYTEDVEGINIKNISVFERHSDDVSVRAEIDYNLKSKNNIKPSHNPRRFIFNFVVKVDDTSCQGEIVSIKTK